MNLSTILDWLKLLSILIIKELKQLYRDPVLLVIIIYFFTADVYLAGDGVRMTLHHGALFVIDRDHSNASRDLISSFRPPYFDLKAEIFNQHHAEELLNQGKALAILDIPENFQHDLMNNKPVSLQLQVDASNTTLGTLASAYSNEIVMRINKKYSQKNLGYFDSRESSMPMIQDRHRIYYNPNQTDSWFISISELFTVITMLSMMLPAAAAVREKERGTIEQLSVSPLSPLQILLPKVMAMGLVLVFATAVCLFLIIQSIFHLPIKGSPLFFLMVTALYVFATSGIGLYIAAISRNLGQVSMLVILLLLPILLLSGAWTPQEAMPIAIRWAMFASPLYYYIEMGYDILLKGAGIDILWDMVLELGLLGSIIFIFGIQRFRKHFG